MRQISRNVGITDWSANTYQIDFYHYDTFLMLLSYDAKVKKQITHFILIYFCRKEALLFLILTVEQPLGRFLNFANDLEEVATCISWWTIRLNLNCVKEVK